MRQAALAFALICAAAAVPAARVLADTAAPAASTTRIEARSASLMAVGIVQGDHMSIHISRLLDNAPVRDATVTVLLRGAAHPTTAEADGSYSLQTPDLTLAGQATVLFRVAQAGTVQDLKGAFQIADTDKPEEKNSARQLGWWVLNFAVCIGFLMLISRRRKAAAQD